MCMYIICIMLMPMYMIVMYIDILGILFYNLMYNNNIIIMPVCMTVMYIYLGFFMIF